MELTHPTTNRPSTLLGRMPRQSIVAVLVLLGALGLAVVMSRTEAILAPLWLLAMAAGFTLQRSRFCFASAFRDLFLFGSSRIMKGIIVGLAIATIGFAINMYSKVPFPEFGVLPNEANILPVGISTIVAGLLFGFGMVISGGCVSGSLYRMAEGYVASWVSMVGILIGLGFLSQTWNWWWEASISSESMLWIPSKFSLGYGGGVILTLGGLLIAFLLFLWWESRSGLSIPDIQSKKEPDDTLGEKLSILWRSVFVRGWPSVVGGGVLGVIGVLMYMVHMPWGVTGELARLSNTIMSTLNFAPPEPLGLSDLGGCSGLSDATGLFSHSFAVTVGLLPGALVGALFASEFKLRFPRNPRRYMQALGGGIIMGYGAGLAIGCTVGAFFSSIPSLSISGWLFALALSGGAFLGVQVIKRIA
ncbi:YeeE/YedE family protein [SAR202 cluster bacterium AC-647-N09_OGT_505m]|nr:YeeE/YedE family protein [SAR202 cluster bacterium AC-647-N09_OGT_505m]